VGGVSVGYAYDGDGNRASQTVDGTVTAYLYDRAARCRCAGGRGTTVHVGSGSGAALRVKGDGTIEGATRTVCSVRALTDAAGVLVQTYGDATASPRRSVGGFEPAIRFTGEQRDSSTGLVYLRRAFDPQTGRFLQRDTVAKGSGQLRLER